jgi:hypothetical protein
MNGKMSFYASDDSAYAVTAEQDIENIFGSSAGFLSSPDDFPADVGEAFWDTEGRFPMAAIVDALRKDHKHPGSEFWFARLHEGSAQISPLARYLTVGLDDSEQGYHLRREYQATERRYLATVQSG